MARRRRKEGATISLLPILSIQKCTMGIMVVLICAQNLVSLGQTERHKDDQHMEIVGGGQGKEGVYVECQPKGILIHPARTAVSLDTLKGPGPSPFHALLDELRGSGGKKYLVLLIRPEGVATYYQCLRMARQRKSPDEPVIDVGKEALLTGGDVVLTKDGKPLLSVKKGGRP